MDLTVRDVAKLLGVPEKTVHRWIEKEGLPAYRLHEQYRLNRVELQEWAVERRIKVPAGLFAAEEGERPMLAPAIERGGIHYDVPGLTRELVLRAVSALPTIPAGVDRELLYRLLVTRETLSSTGFGGGIAIPHPRNPLVLHLEEPLVMICFLARGVDFGALDGQPVTVLFPLLSPTVQSHLHMLSRLSYALHDAGLRRGIDARAPAGEILRLVRAVDAAVATSAPDGATT